MKAVYLFPLAFVADVHGLLIFVPYLFAILMAGYLLRVRRQSAAIAIPVRIEPRPTSVAHLSQRLPSL